MGSNVPETWKRYHFRAETPCIGHYRKYLLRVVTSRYLQSGDQLEPISTDGTCIGWISLLSTNMFKIIWAVMLMNSTCQNTCTYMVFSIAITLLYSLFRCLLWFVGGVVFALCTSCLWPATLFNNILFFLSCVCTMEVVGISVEAKVCFFWKATLTWVDLHV